MEDKYYFLPGDLVKLNKDIPNAPVMLVVGKETNRFMPNKDEAGKDYLQGIKCRWFTDNKELQEAVWNTKDLILY